MSEVLLWDFETTRKKLCKSVQGMRWLIRTRQVEGMVRVGRRIYFDPEDIKKWIEKNKIKNVKGNNT